MNALNNQRTVIHNRPPSLSDGRDEQENELHKQSALTSDNGLQGSSIIQPQVTKFHEQSEKERKRTDSVVQASNLQGYVFNCSISSLTQFLLDNGSLLILDFCNFRILHKYMAMLSATFYILFCRILTK